MGNILDPVDGFDLVEALDGGRQAAMEREDLVFNNCGEGQILKNLCEKFPYRFCSILPHALVIEPIVSIDLAVFVIASEEGDAVSVLDFEDKHVQESLDTMVAAIDVISHEEEVCFLNKRKKYGQFSTDLENFQQVVELAMNIATDCDGSSHLHHIGLFHQDLLHLI